jgi:hypothetical protein
MRSLTIVMSVAVTISAVALLASPQEKRAEPPSLVGAWTLNKEASDAPAALDEGAGRTDGRSGAGGGGYGGGGRGGFGGGGFGGGGRPGRGSGDAEATRRMQAMRDLMEAPEQLTITQTESLVIVTSGDGRTTRLSADGKTIKDESSGLSRKTRWDNSRLVSEISGARDKITETYTVDREQDRLTITVLNDNVATR